MCQSRNDVWAVPLDNKTPSHFCGNPVVASRFASREPRKQSVEKNKALFEVVKNVCPAAPQTNVNANPDAIVANPAPPQGVGQVLGGGAVFGQGNEENLTVGHGFFREAQPRKSQIPASVKAIGLESFCSECPIRDVGHIDASRGRKWKRFATRLPSTKCCGERLEDERA
jgi:hypothetical protein